MADSHFIQLTIALIGGLILFFVANLSFNKTYLFLLLIIPFQVISSRYGSMNFAFSLVLWVVFLFRERQKIKVPMPITAFFILILFSMVFSLLFAPRAIWKINFIYIYDFAQNYIMIALAVNYLRSEKRIISFLRVMGVCNVLVIGFTILQAIAGSQGIALGGIQELEISSRIEEKSRLLGPIGGASQSNVTYLIIQSMFALYAVFTFATKRTEKICWIALLLGNVGIIVGTGTRSGYLGFCLAMILLSLFFIRQFGIGRVSLLFFIGALVLSSMTFLVIRQTKYNTMMERLSKTEVHGIEVDSRKGLIPMYWEEIIKKPIFGHRPMLEIDRKQSHGLSDIFVASPPHNFYLYALFSTGFVGLMAHLLFFSAFFGYLLFSQKKWKRTAQILKALPALMISLFIVFLIMQFFISYIRFSMSDFQDYIFTIFGLMLSLYLIPRQKKFS